MHAQIYFLSFQQFQPPQKKCIIPTCTNLAEPDSVYCSEQCIVKHAEESLVVIEQQKQLRFGSKSVCFSLSIFQYCKITHVKKGLIILAHVLKLWNWQNYFGRFAKERKLMSSIASVLDMVQNDERNLHCNVSL